MLISDSVAAAGSFAILALLLAGCLEVWNIYAINAVIGITNAFQQPASAVALGKLVPKEKVSNADGIMVGLPASCMQRRTKYHKNAAYA